MHLFCKRLAKNNMTVKGGWGGGDKSEVNQCIIITREAEIPHFTHTRTISWTVMKLWYIIQQLFCKSATGINIKIDYKS